MKMYNFQKIINFTNQDMFLLCCKADAEKGIKGRKLRKHVAWLLDEVF